MKAKPKTTDAAKVEILCRLYAPLGYRYFRPVDDRTLDEHLHKAADALGIKPGQDLIRITVTKEG